MIKDTVSVLLVDDDDRNIFALSAYLKAKKIIVHTASDGQQCLEKLAELSVDVVLLDMMMPVMDGFETLRHLRKDAALSQNKVIALTALAMKGDKEKCMEAGADDYCTKPIDINELLNKIDGLLK
jgi:two-component system chemotaxis sensor kinase CheA